MQNTQIFHACDSDLDNLILRTEYGFSFSN